MIDPDVAMQAAVGEALKDCGLPADEDVIEDFLDALYAHGYVIERRATNKLRPETS